MGKVINSTGYSLLNKKNWKSIWYIRNKSRKAKQIFNDSRQFARMDKNIVRVCRETPFTHLDYRYAFPKRSVFNSGNKSPKVYYSKDTDVIRPIYIPLYRYINTNSETVPNYLRYNSIRDGEFPHNILPTYTKKYHVTKHNDYYRNHFNESISNYIRIIQLDTETAIQRVFLLLILFQSFNYSNNNMYNTNICSIDKSGIINILYSFKYMCMFMSVLTRTLKPTQCGDNYTKNNSYYNKLTVVEKMGLRVYSDISLLNTQAHGHINNFKSTVVSSTLDSHTICQLLREKLESRDRRGFKKLLYTISSYIQRQKGIVGLRVEYNGRPFGSIKTVQFRRDFMKVNIHDMKKKIDYCTANCYNKFGITSVKVWIAWHTLTDTNIYSNAVKKFINSKI